jgi:hypothetical protein
LVIEDVFPHDESCKAIGESVDPRARVRVCMRIWPDNIETGVDMRDGESMKG